jgi:hypothetical protein
MWRVIRLLLVALLSTAPCSAPATAAQAETSAEEIQKQTGQKEPRKARVRVRVLLLDPKSKQPPRPLPKAMVKIVGEEGAPPDTDEEGMTPSLIISPRTITLVVQPSGAEPCPLELTVKQGPQTVTVLVELSPDLKCTLRQTPAPAKGKRPSRSSE